MSSNNANCALCGKPLKYFEEAQKTVCALCGKEDSGHSICTDGHYICDLCHRVSGVDFILDACSRTQSDNPIEIAQSIMDDKSIYPNGPEHHSLVGAALLAAYKNAGGDVDLDRALDELRNRSMLLPGGTCGYWGICGAAASAGQFYSIVVGATPMKRDPWTETARLTSRIISRIADTGGPRCCKRTSFIAIEESASYVAQTLDVKMTLPEKTICRFMSGNAECLKTSCPFFPAERNTAK